MSSSTDDKTKPIRRSAVNLHCSDVTKEEAHANLERAKYGKAFSDVEQLNLFLSLPLTDEQRVSLLEKLKK